MHYIWSDGRSSFAVAWDDWRLSRRWQARSTWNSCRLKPSRETDEQSGADGISRCDSGGLITDTSSLTVLCFGKDTPDMGIIIPTVLFKKWQILKVRSFRSFSYSFSDVAELKGGCLWLRGTCLFLLSALFTWSWLFFCSYFSFLCAGLRCVQPPFEVRFSKKDK